MKKSFHLGQLFHFFTRLEISIWKFFLPLLFSLTLFSGLNAQPNLIFSEGFELNGISEWTLYTTTTDNWNLTTDDGINGLSCVRCIPNIFETPYPENDSWVISPEIDISIYESVNLEFYTRMYEEGLGIEIYYSTNYNGSFTTADWIKLDSIYNEEYYTWYLSEYTFETNNEDFHIAFRYQSTTTECNWWYVDEIAILGNTFEIIPVGTSENFEYYCYDEADTGFMDMISEELEMKYSKYCLEWNRPGQPKALDNEFQKIKIYYGDRDDHSFDDIANAPNWKCSFYDTQNTELYLCPLISEDQLSYYNDLIGLAKHTFGAYALYKRQERDGYINYPPYYQEGFGLYESGYRPNRDSIITIRNEYNSNIPYEDLYDTSMIVNTAKKDLVVSYVEGQIICLLGYRYCFPDYGTYTSIWNRYLSHFYDTTDQVQIKNYYSSELIDVYCSSRDTMYQEEIAGWIEETLIFYKDSFEMELNSHFHVCIYYDEQTGIELTIFDNFNGGSGSINISPHNFYDGIDGYPWLMAHEFGHVFNDFMYFDFPFGFFHEGMANFSGLNSLGDDWSDSKWKIAYVFNYYENKYDREPTLDEFINNPDASDPDFYGIDPYFFGLQFIRYIYREYDHLKLKEFFNEGLDFNVFDMTYEEIEEGYIDFLYLIKNNGLPALYVNETFDILQGETKLITIEYLYAVDAISSDEELKFISTKLPSNGQFELVDQPGIAIDRFSQQDIVDQQVQYVHYGLNMEMDSLCFYLTDGLSNLTYQKFFISVGQITTSDDLEMAEEKFRFIQQNNQIKIIAEFEIDQLILIDLSGKIIEKKAINSYEAILDCNRFKTGVYLLQLVEDGNLLSRKIVIK